MASWREFSFTPRGTRDIGEERRKTDEYIVQSEAASATSCCSNVNAHGLGGTRGRLNPGMIGMKFTSMMQIDSDRVLYQYIRKGRGRSGCSGVGCHGVMYGTGRVGGLSPVSGPCCFNPTAELGDEKRR